ncbi:hypothetical protein BDZ89DRAFT_1063332 [Hymenopellis radicata]|nr:hypothetical protein BDZ89DRAFT_1063332 [Hymenopellis radicata]
MAVQKAGAVPRVAVQPVTTPSPKQWAHKALLKVGLALHGPTLGYHGVVVVAPKKSRSAARLQTVQPTFLQPSLL